MRTTCLFLSLSLSFLIWGSCATSPSNPTRIDFVELKAVAPQSPTETAQAEEAVAAPSAPEPFKDATVTLSFSLPEEWGVSVQNSKKHKARLYLLYHPQGGVIVILSYPTAEDTPLNVVRYLRDTDRRDAFKVYTITAAGDGSKARQVWYDRHDQRRGITEAHVLSNDKRVTAVLIGSWPAEFDRSRTVEFNGIVDSVKYE